MYYAHSKYIGNKEFFNIFLYKRFIRIFPLYWLANFIVIILLFNIPTFGAEFSRNPKYILNSLLLIPQENGFLLPQAWTLTYELIFYIMFSLLIFNNKKLTIYTYITWSIIFILNIFNIIPKNVLTSTLFNSLFLEFIIGYVTAFLILKFKNKFSIIKATAFIIAGFTLFILFGNLFIFGNNIIRCFSGFSFALILFGTSIIDLNFKLHLPNLLTVIGDASFSIYLTHFTILQFVVPYIYKNQIFNTYGINKTITLISVLLVLIGVLIHISIEKPLVKLFKLKKNNINYNKSKITH